MVSLTIIESVGKELMAKGLRVFKDSKMMDGNSIIVYPLQNSMGDISINLKWK